MHHLLRLHYKYTQLLYTLPACYCTVGIFSTCEAGPLVIFDAITCAQQVFAHSIWVSMLSWYRSMFKSKPRHKLATLPGLQREYITQFPLALKRRFSVWILQLLIDWIFFVYQKKMAASKRTHTLFPLRLFFHSFSPVYFRSRSTTLSISTQSCAETCS